MSKQKRRYFAIGCVILWIVLALCAVAHSRDVTYVTREDSNLYRTNDGRLIKTWGCYVYAYSQKAVVTSSTLYFLDWNDEAEDSCDIEAIYRKER